jgi:hypothetical protein
MSRHPLRLTLLALLVCIAAWPQPALAREADELAQRHFEAGVSYLQQSDHEKALQEFQRSFELSNRPEVLLNVATVHERMGNLAQAVEALERYLALEPEGEHAETVKIRIENLKKRMPAEVEEPPAEQSKAQPVEPAPQPEQAAPAPASPAPTQPAAAREPSHTLAYVFFAGAGAFAAGAVVTGIMANGEHSDLKSNCSPFCNDEQTSRGRTLALVSTVLTGVAVAAAAGGVVLWVTADGASEAPVATGAPRVDLDVGETQVRASATWSF